MQIRNTAFFLSNFRIADWDTKEICGFAICGLAHLRICDCGISPRIGGFAICGLTKKFACPPLLYNVSVNLLCYELSTLTELYRSTGADFDRQS
jgi:hypothetical protein